MYATSLVHLFQTFEHLAGDVAYVSLAWYGGALNVVNQTHVHVLNLQVLRPLNEAVSVVSNNSIAAFLVQNAQVVRFLCHDVSAS